MVETVCHYLVSPLDELDSNLALFDSIVAKLDDSKRALR